MKIENCTHPEYARTPGEFETQHFGTIPIEHCSLCGAWRAPTASDPAWRTEDTAVKEQAVSEVY